MSEWTLTFRKRVMNMAIDYVIAKQVSKHFGHQQVLNQIDLTLPTGTIYGLIGPSGAGKTTLIKSILGMEAVDSLSLIHISEPTRP